MIFDPKTERGARALERLASDTAAWLTTVTPEGQPQSMPVWFVWYPGADGTDDEILVYGDHRAKRNRNLDTNPKVSFHLADDHGQDIVTIEGTVRVDPDLLGPGDNPAYMAKYGQWIEGMGGPEKFGQTYSMPIRITPTRGVSFQG